MRGFSFVSAASGSHGRILNPHQEVKIERALSVPHLTLSVLTE